ncbi:hypothetical protein [Roseivivax sediminis]|uniref:Lipoprotein n=1 Tax=Roseivivax sediminis TaxID=936889 RepID=A0A1I2CEB3_9RHOB|nr:hypothetical protein [Roseivivax sediminis]SFE66020.1 hypothetical protein SAMN04515678_11357 [Roseivivax sediminis]
MKTSIGVLLVSALVLTSCGTVRDSRLNPFNWFGGATSRPVTVEAGSEVNPLLPRRSSGVSIFRRERSEDQVYAGTPIAVIDELLVERRPGGAIIRATGIADRAGPFDIRLIPDETAGGGALVYTFNALQRPGPRDTGPDARKATAAVWLTDNELAGISRIEVRGRQNILTSRR